MYNSDGGGRTKAMEADVQKRWRRMYNSDGGGCTIVMEADVQKTQSKLKDGHYFG
jgi:hypothetical protein